MSDKSIPRFEIVGVPDIPFVEPGDSVAAALKVGLDANNLTLERHDIVVVASKAVSFSEDRIVLLDTVDISDEARTLHRQIPRKPESVLQLILNETEGNLFVKPSGHILGTLPNGMQLTSGGVDKLDTNRAILLPVDSDASAEHISHELSKLSGVEEIGIVIADSEGKPDRQGAGTTALGSYGVPALRKDAGGTETFCDLVAGAGSLVLGQRGHGYPVAIIKGLDYEWSPDGPNVGDILNRS